jgi:DNA-binding GntR family transcriptional regulator
VIVQSRERPTAEQIERALQLPPGTIVFERSTERPAPGDPYQIRVRVEDVGRGRWRIELMPS